MEKIIVTHRSPDLDAITSVWLIRTFLPGWEEARVRFVSAGEKFKEAKGKDVIEVIGEEEVIHVDTGLTPLDHHQTDSNEISAASLTWDYIKTHNPAISSDLSKHKETKWKHREEAIRRMIRIVVDIDHFQEVFWTEAESDRNEFNLAAIIDGLKLQKPNQDKYYVEFVGKCLDSILHSFENKVWAEEEIKEKGIEFQTSFGKGLGVESLNDTVIKLGQKRGFVLVIRKDPRKGYVRIKTIPQKRGENLGKEVDLTNLYNVLKKKDPNATWFLHVSKKMLLNGSPKSGKMVASSLSLTDIIETIKNC